MSAVRRDLPGSELVEQGLADLAGGRESAESLLVRMASPRLRALGIDVPERMPGEPPHHRLYALLAERDPRSAHSAYNALVGRIASFARAAEHAPQR